MPDSSELETVTPEGLRTLGRLSVSGVALFDDRRFHFVSPPFCYQTGHSEAELLALSPGWSPGTTSCCTSSSVIDRDFLEP